MMICDSHIHVGALSDTEIMYPHDLKEFLHEHNIQCCCVIPTAKIDGGDDGNLHDKLYRDAKEMGIKPILYVNHEILNKLKQGEFSDANFCGIKIHPDAINISDGFIKEICEIAIKRGIPLLIHTGEREGSHSARFANFIEQYRNVKFILCHARPADEAFYLLNNYHNVWIDTAFLPIEILRERTKMSNYKRILFGTDFPTNRWFNFEDNDDVWYDKQINSIKASFPKDIAQSILHDNFYKLFNMTN